MTKRSIRTSPRTRSTPNGDAPRLALGAGRRAGRDEGGATDDEGRTAPKSHDVYADEQMIEAAVIAVLERRGWAIEDGPCAEGWWFPPAFGGYPLCIACQDQDETADAERLGPVPPRVQFVGGDLETSRLLVFGAGSGRFACPDHAATRTTVVVASATRDSDLARLQSHLAQVESASTQLDPEAYIRCYLDGPCRRRFDAEFIPPPQLGAAQEHAKRRPSR